MVFDIAMEAFDNNREAVVRPGEQLSIKAVDLHFGRFGGTYMRVAWTVLGLVPLFLAVSGVALWWTGRRARAKLPSGAHTAPSGEVVGTAIEASAVAHTGAVADETASDTA